MNDYALWYSEINTSEAGFEVTRKIAALLAVRLTWGSAVIVCDTPHNLLPTFRKRWEQILRLVEIEYSTTKGNVAKAEMKRYLRRLESTQFFDMLPDEDEGTAPTVWLIEGDDLNKIPPRVMTIYVMSDLSMPQLLFWVRHLKDGSKIVMFRKDSLGYMTDRRERSIHQSKRRKQPADEKASI